MPAILKALARVPIFPLRSKTSWYCFVLQD
jgi:hypothetical protein